MITDNIIPWDQMESTDRLVFHHLPKTAGTALSSGLHNFYGESHYKWFHGPAGVLEEMTKGTELRAIGGHFHLNHPLARALTEPVVMVTLFRDPVDRVISNYYYIRNNTEHPAHPVARDNSLKEVYEKGLGVKIHVVDSITKMVSITNVPGKYLASAKNMVNRYTFFGLQEQTNVMEALMRRFFNNDQFFIPLLTARSMRPAVEEVDLETIRLIKNHNQQDIALYEYVKEVYDRKINEEWI